MKAASLNHHDLWSLRGIGLPESRLPMVLGCDAAGLDEDGNEVIVYSVVSDIGPGIDETMDESRSILSGEVSRHLLRTFCDPCPQFGSQTSTLVPV